MLPPRKSRSSSNIKDKVFRFFFAITARERIFADFLLPSRQKKSAIKFRRTFFRPFLIRSTLKANKTAKLWQPTTSRDKATNFQILSVFAISSDNLKRDVKVETRKIKSNAPRKTLFIVPESLMITKQNEEVFNYFSLYLYSDYLPFVSFFLATIKRKSRCKVSRPNNNSEPNGWNGRTGRMQQTPDQRL